MSKKPQEKVYPKVEVRLCRGEKALTAQQAKDFLGWKELPEEYKGDFFIKDHHGTMIQCDRNMKNRFFYNSNMELLKQDILNGNYVFNGEPIIIGDNGDILNGQHTLTALVLAHQEWEEDEETTSPEPKIEKLIVLGVSSEDKVVNTIDTPKPRSASDMLGRSGIFNRVLEEQKGANPVTQAFKKKFAKTVEFACRFVWSRTGRFKDAYTPKLTHSVVMDFISKHPKLLEYAYSITDENEEGGISKYIPPGQAAGLLYLMAASNSSSEDYYDDPGDHNIDWENEEDAMDFMVSILEMTPFQQAYKQMIVKLEGGTSLAKTALLIKAWEAWKTKRNKIDQKDIRLKYAGEEGEYVLDDFPILEGIDKGEPSQQHDSDEEE